MRAFTGVVLLLVCTASYAQNLYAPVFVKKGATSADLLRDEQACRMAVVRREISGGVNGCMESKGYEIRLGELMSPAGAKANFSNELKHYGAKEGATGPTPQPKARSISEQAACTMAKTSHFKSILNDREWTEGRLRSPKFTCTDFESITDEGVAKIDLAVGHEVCPVDACKRGTQTYNKKFNFYRTDQGWKIR